MTYPETVSELFPSKWLKAADLEKPVTVEIEDVAFETVYDARSKEHVLKLTISFQGAQKRLIPNKTQCEALWKITDSERFLDWVGKTVTLAPGVAHNGKPTIVISRPNGWTRVNNEPPVTDTE